MLYSHKFIDVLRGASQEIPLRLIGTTTAQASAFAELINDAEKFDFGELPLEPDPTEPGKLLLPPLTPVEREAWTDGLIPLPAPLCWFEFTLKGYLSGILVRDGWTCSRYDWVKELMFDGHAARISDGMMSPSSKNLEVVIKGTIMTRDPALLRQIYGMIPPTAIYLALMLCSRSTEVTQSDEPARKLNVARAKMGRAPLEQHHAPGGSARPRREGRAGSVGPPAPAPALAPQPHTRPASWYGGGASRPDTALPSWPRLGWRGQPRVPRRGIMLTFYIAFRLRLSAKMV